jgi:NAD(P)-dependent dehydrogenase (short-subunit alcohol dehydrogenase family)
MSTRFQNKVVFITGGSAGIGAALGMAFAREGARVVLSARHQDALDQVVRKIQESGGEAMAVVCDVTDRASLDAAVKKAVDSFGGIDVAVANAGFGVSGRLQDLTTSDYRRQFELNFFGMLDTIYATVPELKKSRGRLVLISSIMGKFGRAGSSPYASSKHAVCGLADSLYYELIDEGVAVTCINPGLVESHFRMVDNKNEYQADVPDPAPRFFVVPAPKAARQILRAVHRRKKEAVITGHGKVIVFVARHFPGLARVTLRLASRSRAGS